MSTQEHTILNRTAQESGNTIRVVVPFVFPRVNVVIVFFQSMPSERLRNQLSLMSFVLHRAISTIEPVGLKVRYSVCSK